jgi:hypothetical protein
MSLLEKLAVNKKITAFFVDGSQKMNLGISAAAALLNGSDRVPVHVAPAQRASRLLKELAEKSSLTVERVPEGVFLVQPGSVEPQEGSSEPVVEVQPESVAPIVDVKPVQEITQPEPVAEAVVELEPVEIVQRVKANAPKVARKYTTLSATFFRGSCAGQILSVFKTRVENPAKVADFRAALAAGDCVFPAEPLPKAVVEKATELGIEVPENLVA